MNAKIPSLVLFILLTSTAASQTISWNNPAGGMWTEASNWDLNRVPTAADTVVITLPGTYTVALGGSGAARCLTLGADSGTQTLSVTPTWYNGVHLAVGGTLTARANSRIIIDLFNLGDLVVDSTFTNAGTFTVTNSSGVGYQGAVQVRRGWLVNDGTISILQGAGGGRTIDAALDNRGIVNANWPVGFVKASAQHINSGTINVRADISVSQSGSSPSFTNRGVVAIDSGKTLLIEEGQFVHDGGAVTGRGAIRMANVKGTLLSDFTVGIPAMTLVYSAIGGSGTLRIPVGTTLTLMTDSINCPLDVGGSLSCIASAFLGATTYIVGQLTTQSSSNIAVDVGNQCKLVVDTTFTNAGTITIYASGGGYSGHLGVRNGWLINAGTINIPAGGAASGRSLDASLDNRGVVNVDVLLTVIKASSQHINSGTINVRAPLTVQPASGYADLSNRGTIAISSGKSLVINPGTFRNNTTGLVNIGVDGRVADVNLAQLRVFGGAFLGGTLNLLLAQNFIPELDDSLVVVTAYSRSGAFQSIRIPTLNGNPLLVAGYGAANVHLKAFIDFANIRELTIGQPYGDSLRSGFYRFYKVFLPAGVSPWFRAGCADPLVAPQLFVARGGLPSRSQFDFSSRVELPQLSEISIPSVDSGMHFLLAHNAGGDDALYTLQVDTLGHMLRRVRLPESGNSGEVTVEILGAQLQEGARASLSRLGQVTVPDTAGVLIDGTQLNARFVLANLATGDWDVTVVNPDSSVALLPHGMTLRENTAPQLDLSLSGPAAIHRDYVGQYVLSATNPSNTNVERALVFIETRPEIEISARLDSAAVDSLLDDRSLKTWLDSTGMRVFCLTYSNIAPSRTKQLELLIRPTAFGEYTFWGHIATFSRRLYDSLIVEARKEGIEKGWFDTTSVPPRGQMVSMRKGVLNSTEGPADAQGDIAYYYAERERAADASGEVAGTVRDGFTSMYFPMKKPGPGIFAYIAGLLVKMRDAHDRFERRRHRLPGPQSVQSYDPNDIFVPVGNGALNWVQGKPLPYRIEFENLADSATAPARHVRIRYTLDPWLDPASLSLGEFGFRNLQFTIPAGRSSYLTRIDLSDSLGMYVDMAASLEGDSVIWTFETIDPHTGWPVTDPLGGFLPVNDQTGRGTGYVSFTVSPKALAPTGAVISAQAVIVFDSNAPVATARKFNTLDPVPPTSHVLTLEDSSDGTFDVLWSGSDDGGIASYTVYVSADGSAFGPWVSAWEDTLGRFAGSLGSSYGFFSIAQDTAGNVERLKLFPEATTRVVTEVMGTLDVPAWYRLFQNYPNPFNPATTIRIALPEAGHVTLTVYNILGQRVVTLVDEKLTAGYHDIHFNASHFPSGVYFYHLEAGSYAATCKMLLIK